jgi:hypothetical protein
MTSEDQERKDQIWRFVLEHQEFFCDPPPEGLGFPRPGMIPGHYLKRPEEWALDRIRVQKLKRERQLRDGTANRTVSTGMAPGTRQLLDDIRRLAREGHTTADISAQLDVTEAGVRNVLALGQGVYEGDAQGPVHLPQIAAFRKNWGRSWPGGHVNGNGHRKPESAV